ncbi:MAG: prephenate dehydrogenase/arogenate dehydrogenase family protein [bacterium]
MAGSHTHSGVHRLAIIGVGMMGGSLALAARTRAEVDAVVGFDSDPVALDSALRDGVITEAATSAAEAAAYADLVVISTPVRSIPPLVEECAGAEPRPRLISDMGSTKSAIIRSLSPLARSLFIGGHPICGAADSGVRYARPDLFEGATYFLCTTGAAFPKLYEMLQQFVVDLGARPTHVDAVAHDRIMAVVSHVPHVLANLLMEHAGTFQVGGKSALHWVGPSFKDLTRVAGANPPMWRDIFLENREALSDSLRALISELEAFSARLDTSDEAGIVKAIDSAVAFRDELLKFEDIAPETLYRVTARIPDQPGVLSRVMAALGDAGINIEDLTLHHVSRSVGGDLVLFVAGQDTAETASVLLDGLGYPTVVSFTGDSGG